MATVILAGDGGGSLALEYLSPSGALDPAYGTGGVVTVAGPSCWGIFTGPANSLLAVTSDVAVSTMSVTRLTGTGTIDPTYGVNGVASWSVPSIFCSVGPWSAANGTGAMAFAVTGVGFPLAIIKLDANGQLDAGFGVSGMVSIPVLPETITSPVMLPSLPTAVW